MAWPKSNLVSDVKKLIGDCDGMIARMTPVKGELTEAAYVPGDNFFADGRGFNTMRLNFAGAADEMMESSIKLLGA